VEFSTCGFVRRRGVSNYGADARGDHERCGGRIVCAVEETTSTVMQDCDVTDWTCS
jgi:hypothetical protein